MQICRCSVGTPRRWVTDLGVRTLTSFPFRNADLSRTRHSGRPSSSARLLFLMKREKKRQQNRIVSGGNAKKCNFSKKSKGNGLLSFPFPFPSDLSPKTLTKQSLLEPRRLIISLNGHLSAYIVFQNMKNYRSWKVPVSLYQQAMERFS